MNKVLKFPQKSAAASSTEHDITPRKVREKT